MLRWPQSALTHASIFSPPISCIIHHAVGYLHSTYVSTRMWANAQRDGRPAEHRSVQCRKVWLTLTTWLPYSNAAKSRKPLKLDGVPQTGKPISAASGPKFTISWGHLEVILLLNKFFSDCRYVPQLRRYSPTKLCDGAQMAIFGDFFASCVFSEPRAAGFRPAS